MAKQPSNDRHNRYDENLNWNDIPKIETSTSQKNRRILLLVAVIISLGVAFSNGIYEFSSPNHLIVHKYNKFTGTVEVCTPQKGCVSIKNLK
jgi:hypothetical protein